MATGPVYEMEGDNTFPLLHDVENDLPNDAPPPYFQGLSRPLEDEKMSAHDGQESVGQPGTTRHEPVHYAPITGVMMGHSTNHYSPHSMSGARSPLSAAPLAVTDSSYVFPPPPPLPPRSSHPVSPASSCSPMSPVPTINVPYVPHQAALDQQSTQPTLHRPHSQVFFPPPPLRGGQHASTAPRPQSTYLSAFNSFNQPQPMMRRPHSQVFSPPPNQSVLPTIAPPPTIVQPIPQRPPLEHVFSDPYIAPFHPSQQQHPSLKIPQYEHSVVDPNPQLGRLTAPALPPRPLSAPPTQTNQPLHIPVTQGVPVIAAQDTADAQKSHFGKRFAGNMLLVRVARSGVTTAVSSAKLPFHLSPWGDNNPITLPNVRVRDVALMGLMTIGVGFGLDALAPGVAEVIGPIVEHGVIMTSEQVVHEGTEAAHGKLGKPKKGPKVIQRGGVNSLQISIKHKFMGVDAMLQMLGEKECPLSERVDCSKGWFCPYLYATGRTPHIPRSRTFTMAQLHAPGLSADASLAPILLSALSSISTIHALCPIEPSSPHVPRYRRILLCVIGISPYRTRSSWSQSRLPNEGRFSGHVLSNVPAVVLPVKPEAPVCAWSCWTVEQMLEASTASMASVASIINGHPHGPADSGNAYDAQKHYYELLEFVDKVVDESIMPNDVAGDWKQRVAEAVWGTIDSVKGWGALWRSGELGKVMCLDRAGVVAFRY